MPDYIYLLENRLSADQQNALRQMREAARQAGMILFLTGDAVRDLTSGHAARDLEVAVHGNALTLKGIVENMGATVWGEAEDSRSLYLCFPGTVRVDVISTHRCEYPKPGHPVCPPAPILDDLRRRDFTVNAMAISLNEGSFGLLMDPLNGAADIESQTLRLVSNYGFLEEPSLLIRATRYHARLGWEMDSRTRTRYENAKGEDVIQYLSPQARSQELEQIGHEADGLKVLQALEAEEWMKVLFPAWTSTKADEDRLKALHELALELLSQGVHADMSAAQMELLTAKLILKELAALKKQMLRPGFVQEWNSLDTLAAGFAKALLAKENATPSASYKLFTSYDPEAILWLGFTSNDAAVKEHFNNFLKVWPEVRQRIPHPLLQELRITPELAGYNDVLQSLFLELIDGRLTTAEELRAFLEPYSPPAPPQKETIKRPRAKRGEAKIKEETFDEDEDSEGELDEDEDLDDLGVDFGGDEAEIDLSLNLPKEVLGEETEEEAESLEDEEEETEPVPAKRAAKTPASASKLPASASSDATPATPPSTSKAKVQKPAAIAPIAAAAAHPQKIEKSKTVSQPNSQAASKPEPKSKTAAKPHTELKLAPAPAFSAKSSHVIAKPAPAKVKPQAAKPVVKIPAKPAATVKTAGKVAIKATVKAAVKAAPAKGKPAPAASSKSAAKPSKPAPKGTTSKPAKKH